MIFSIVIPAYNEERAIGLIIERAIRAKKDIMARAKMDDVEIIVVNDGSKDGTESAAGKHNDIVLVSYKENKGYGAALKEGFKKAKGELVGFLDADGTCDPEFFTELINSMMKNGSDIAVGSRLGPESRMPAIRCAGNMLYAWLINLFGTPKTVDCASGMRVLRRGIIEKIYPLPDGMHFTPAMSCKAIMDGKIKLIEIPMKYEERIGRSKLNVLKDGVTFLKTIVEIIVAYKPFESFGLAGRALMTAALFFGAIPFLCYFLRGALKDWHIYFITNFIVFTIGGLNFIILGLLANEVIALANRKEGIIHRLKKGVFAKAMHPWNFARAGFVIAASGAVLNLVAVMRFLAAGSRSISWLLVLAGGFLILLGIEIFAYGVLCKILEIYKEKQDFLDSCEKRN